MINLFHRFSTKIVRAMSTRSTMENRFKDKVAVVTASTSGIGYAIAKRLATEGAKVMISSRKADNVNKTVKELKSLGLNVAGEVCHVSNPDHRKNLFARTEELFGGIDILVSNAAVNPAVGPVLDADESAWDKIFDINVKCSFLLAKEALPYLRKRTGSNILFVSSIAGFSPIEVLGAYSVSKTALFGLTKAAAASLANENIRVNCLAPGVIKTPFSSALTDNEPAKSIALNQIPLGRFGVPDEMGSVAAFLVSDDGSYVTGEIIVAGGGMTSRL